MLVCTVLLIVFQAEFCEDIVRIFRGRENRVKKRHLRAARTVFVKVKSLTICGNEHYEYSDCSR